MTSANTPSRTFTSSVPLQTCRMALIVSAGVLCFGLLSYFGYWVQRQVTRGESFREAQRAGLYGVSDGNVVRRRRVPSVEISPLLASATPR